MPCAAGYFNDLTGSATCKPCPAGTFSYSGASACITCPRGSTTNTSVSSCKAMVLVWGNPGPLRGGSDARTAVAKHSRCRVQQSQNTDVGAGKSCPRVAGVLGALAVRPQDCEGQYSRTAGIEQIDRTAG